MKLEKTHKKYLMRIGALFVLELLCALGVMIAENMHLSADTLRYTKQFLVITEYIVALFILRLLFKYYIFDGVKLATRRIAKKIKKIVRFVSGRISTLMTKLGFGRRKHLAIGEDEYSFTFDRVDKEQTKLHVGSISRWKDLRDNNQKLRFLFIRFMIRKIRRGYKKRRGKTPNEWAKELRLHGDALELFDSYNVARYSGGRELVSDEALERARLLCEGKKV